MGGGKKGKKSKKSKRTPASTGRAPSTQKTKAQKMAVANKAKYGGTAKAAAANKAAGRAKAKAKADAKKSTTSTKTSSSKTISTSAQVAKDNKRYGNTVPSGSFGISQAGKDKAAINRGIAAAKKTGIPSGKNLKSGSFGISQAGKKQAAANRAAVKKSRIADGTKVATHDKPLFKSVPARLDQPASKEFIDGMLQRNINPAKPNDLYGIGTKTAGLPSFLQQSIFGNTEEKGKNYLDGVRDTNAADETKGLNKFFKNIQTRDKLLDQSSLGIGNLVSSLANQVMGIQPAGAITMKSPDSFGYPSQDAVDKAAGITAGGLNIGGGGFTPSSPSGGSTSRAIFTGKNPDTSDRPASSFSFGPTADGNEYARNLSEFGMRFGATPEARGKAYEQSLDPNSFKGLSDGMTFGVGPVASGDAYVRGLNTDNQNVENRLRQVRNLGSTLTGGLIPPVRKLADKEIADRRIKNAAFRQANLVGRKRGSSGGARLPVAPLTPEEILLPEETAVAQTGPDYQQALPEQTGVDPNRLLQIQQEAYQQAFNPYNPLTVGGFNPFFRFFNRRGGSRRGSFRTAFRRD